MQEESEHYLTPDEEQALLRIARETLHLWVREHQVYSLDESRCTAALAELHGAFVTLRKSGELRGCVGYTANRAPLAQSVRDCTINAASRDSRFTPVVEEELDAITIEISALAPGDTPETPFKRVDDIGELQIGRDGLYIVDPPRQGGLLLPQVAVEHGMDIEQFLRATCRKAGYPEDSYQQPGIELYRFSAQVFGERAPVTMRS